jgi:hypothetical protein
LGIFNMFYINSGTYPFYLDIAAIGDTMSANGGSNIRFLTHCGTANATPVERMRIDNCGNVGIGISTPDHKLHVFSNSAQEGIKIDATLYPEIVFSRGGCIKGYLAIAGSAGGYGAGTLVDSLILRSENAIHLSPNAGGIALTLASAGIACFSSTVCAPTLRATGAVIGGYFVTDSGTAAIPYNSYATFYTVQNYQNAIYLVTLQLNGYSNYTAFATIIQNDSSLQIANSLSNVAAIQVSGLNIQGTNGSGVTQSMPYKIIRIG